MLKKKVVDEFSSRQEFLSLLQVNPGLIILKLGASWCKPCKMIQPTLDKHFASSPPEVICCDINVDESSDLYAFLKAKKMVNGIPVVLCYVKGNHTFVPDDGVTGADLKELDLFFKRCGKYVKELRDKEKGDKSDKSDNTEKDNNIAN